MRLSSGTTSLCSQIIISAGQSCGARSEACFFLDHHMWECFRPHQVSLHTCTETQMGRATFSCDQSDSLTNLVQCLWSLRGNAARKRWQIRRRFWGDLHRGKLCSAAIALRSWPQERRILLLLRRALIDLIWGAHPSGDKKFPCNFSESWIP